MRRNQRLVRGSDFIRVRKQGRSWSHPLLALAVNPNELATSRFGFVVSKRVGGAVVRNRVKRRMREVVRHRLGEIPAGWDVVLIARAPIAEARFAAIEAAVAQLLARARPWMASQRAAVKQ
jgi:ribonuclease P protein component